MAKVDFSGPWRILEPRGRATDAKPAARSAMGRHRHACTERPALPFTTS